MQRQNWDDLRLFLAIARNGRLIGAGRALGLDHTTVARRLTALEENVGTRLVERTPRGVTLTSAGATLVDHAERIEAEIIAANALLGGEDTRLSGTVRLATPEVFGQHLIAPNAARLHATHPALRLELVPESHPISFANREADLAVTLNRPPRGPVVARSLIDYRIGLYASRDYLDRHGPVDTIDQLVGHPFAWYIDDKIDIPELRLLREAVPAEATPVFRSTSMMAQHAAVASGLGLGLLHVFAAGDDPRLVRVLADEVAVTRTYWLAIHAEQQRLPRIRAVVDLIDEVVALHRDRF